jgi:hypothetical protein
LDLLLTQKHDRLIHISPGAFSCSLTVKSAALIGPPMRVVSGVCRPWKMRAAHSVFTVSKSRDDYDRD